mmetsp:Transcript_12692/g.28411  ORF Transcript_12692/g.28411 Transcript_12692/m.28411 type:complete len:212 (+) Transcript_12692:1440-2075(+)
MLSRPAGTPRTARSRADEMGAPRRQTHRYQGTAVDRACGAQTLLFLEPVKAEVQQCPCTARWPGSTSAPATSQHHHPQTPQQRTLGSGKNRHPQQETECGGQEGLPPSSTPAAPNPPAPHCQRDSRLRYHPEPRHTRASLRKEGVVAAPSVPPSPNILLPQKQATAAQRAAALRGGPWRPGEKPSRPSCLQAWCTSRSDDHPPQPQLAGRK